MNGPCRGWIESLRMEAAVLWLADVLQGGQQCPNDVRGLQHQHC